MHRISIKTRKQNAAKRRMTANPSRIRSSLTPGTIVILLSGRYAGSRAVYLRPLDNGRIAVAGPYGVNFVPLIAIEAARVIATSTKLDISGVDTSALTPEIFKKVVVKSEAKDITEQTEKTITKRTEASAALKAARESIEKPLVEAVKKVELCESYLKSKFTLKNTFGVPAHELKF